MSSADKRPFNRVDDSHSLGQGWTLLLTDIVQITNHVSSSFFWPGPKPTLADHLTRGLRSRGAHARFMVCDEHNNRMPCLLRRSGTQLHITMGLTVITLPVSCVREAIKLLGGQA